MAGNREIQKINCKTLDCHHWGRWIEINPFGLLNRSISYHSHICRFIVHTINKALTYTSHTCTHVHKLTIVNILDSHIHTRSPTNIWRKDHFPGKQNSYTIYDIYLLHIFRLNKFVIACYSIRQHTHKWQMVSPLQSHWVHINIQTHFNTKSIKTSVIFVAVNTRLLFSIS